MKLLRQILGFLVSFFSTSSPSLKIIHVEEAPKKIANQTFYIIGEDQREWFVAFLCPCGCSEKIQLPLIKGKNPSWELTKNHDGTVSLKPSVWRINGCKSHFFLKNSLIQWVGK